MTFFHSYQSTPQASRQIMHDCAHNIGLGIRGDTIDTMGLRRPPSHFPIRKNDIKCPSYPTRHDHETLFPLPLLASKVSSGCFKVSRGERP